MSRRVLKTKILITGTSGFIGTSMAEYLKESGHELVGVDRLPPTEGFPWVKYYPADLLYRVPTERIFAYEKPEVVVHFAAQARVEPSLKDPIATFRDNVEGTINLLELSLRYKVKRFIYASSEIIYGDADEYPVKETDHFRPDSAYAASKTASDVMVQNCHGLNTVVLRSGMGYGPRSPPAQVITKFFVKAMKNEGLLFPAGKVKHPTRDCNYVGNFVEGVKLAIESDKTGVYNFGSGEEYSVLEIAQKIVKIVGKGKVERTDKFTYRTGEAGKRTWLDISKAKKDLGYNPKVKLMEGLQKTYDWLKMNSVLLGVPPEGST